MLAIRFNTGRQYTPEGQIIIAWKHTTEIIRFHDTSRGIKGQIVGNTLHQQFIMEKYDAGQYSSEWFECDLSARVLASSN